ncbi:MAG: chain length determinant protein EpsF [Ramlibacter sp.]|nr:chain length determinant protein EpsF [Ramlibacter sp.]
MSLFQFFYILRARRGLAGLILLATIAMALVWIVLRPSNYTARAPVLIDVRTDPVNATPQHGLVTPSFMSTQIDIVKSERVAQRAVQMLPADQPPMAKMREGAKKPPTPQVLAHQIQQRLEVKPARESNIINIAWTGSSPAEAARVANAFAQAYLETSLELRTDPAKKYADWFEEQVKTSRDKLEKAQAKLSAFQQQSGILSADERGDFESARLTELSQQLMAVQGRGRRGGENSGAVMESPLVNNMRADVAKLEGKFQEAAATMGSAHPQMQRMQAELGAMRSRLASESSRVGSAADSSFAANKNRERELQQALADQKTRVLSMNKQRGELSLLQRDVDTAQKAYEAVSASAAQSRLQSLSTQTNVMRLASAVEPLERTGISGMLALMVAAVGGTLLAIATVLLLELLNRRIRSVEDLSNVTRLPILATVPAAGSSFVPLRLPASRRLALGPRRSLA